MKEYIEHLRGLSQEQLVLLLARQRQRASDPIAIVGCSCRLPGGLRNAEELWAFLEAGGCSVRRYEAGPPGPLGRPRWNAAKFGDEPALKVGSFLEDIDGFDIAGAATVSEQEAVFLDPQQRLLMKCTLEAIESAGLQHNALRGQAVGVFAGVSTVEYLHAAMARAPSAKPLSPYISTGTALSAVAGRIAMTVGGQGPVLSLDSACASLLTALHLAQTAIRNGECEWAVAAASHLLLSPLTTLVFARAGLLSPTGQCRPFDAAADGSVRGEGAGAFLLCSLSTARKQGLPIHAVLRGSAIHQDGARTFMNVATSISQVSVVKKALTAANLQPDDVHYVEAQANGSKLGGQIELESLEQAYMRTRDPGSPLLVGSCKANLGYLETASGIASVLKVIGVLRHRRVPPQINLATPDPAFAWQRSYLKISPQSCELQQEDQLRCAVSCAGFTGTLAHAIFESAPEDGAASCAPAPATGTSNASIRSFWPDDNYWT